MNVLSQGDPGRRDRINFDVLPARQPPSFATTREIAGR